MLGRLKYTLKSTIIYSIGNISLKLVGLILLPIYTEHLVVEDYGRWALLEITSQIFVIIIGFRLSIAMIRFFSAEKEDKKKKTIVFTSVFLTFISLIIFNAFLHPIAGSISNLYFGEAGMDRYFHLLFIWSSVEVLNRLTLDFIRVLQKPVLYVIAVTVRFTLVLGLNIYFVAVRDMGIEGILLGQLIGSIFLFVLTMPYLLLRMNLAIDFQMMKTLIRYGFPLIFSSISIFLLTMGDRYLIKILMEYERVGIYSLSYKVASVVKLILIQAFQLGFIPIVFNMFDKVDFRRFVSKVFTYYSLILVFSSLVLSIFAKDIIYTFAKDPSYYESYRYIPLMLLAFCFQGQQYVFTISLHYTKTVSYLVWITLSAAILNLAFNWFLIPKYGLYGSAVAVNLSSLFMTYLTYIISQRKYHIPYELNKVIMILIVAIVIYLATTFIPVDNASLSIILKSIVVLLFPVLLYPLGFYDAIELSTIAGIWKTWRNPAKWKKNIKRLNNENFDEDTI